MLSSDEKLIKYIYIGLPVASILAIVLWYNAIFGRVSFLLTPVPFVIFFITVVLWDFVASKVSDWQYRRSVKKNNTIDNDAVEDILEGYKTFKDKQLDELRKKYD